MTGSSGFLGFVSTTGIVSLSVRALQTGANPGDPSSYTYGTVDNLVIGRAGANAVPEPATWALALLALLAAHAARAVAPRRR